MAYFLIRKLVHHIQDKREHAATSPSRQQQQHASATQPDLEQDDLSVHDEKSSLTFKLTLLVSLAIPVYLETLDYTVVATAQPHIASVFNRLDLQSYIGTIYLLTSTVFLPFFGSLSDVYGRHFALQVALLFFLIGSALCTGAQNMPMLLAGRGISGIGAGGILTGVRVILADSRSLKDNNWQQVILTVLYTLGYVTGPIIGGALVKVSFRWIFAINLPSTALAMVLIFFLLRTKTKKAIDPQHLQLTRIQRLALLDWFGTFLFVDAGVLILLALNWGSTGTGSSWGDVRVVVAFAVGGVLLVSCLLWEYLLQRMQRGPAARVRGVFAAVRMLPLEVFRSRNVVAELAVSYTCGMVLLVMFYFISIFFIIVNGDSASKSGAQLLYFAPGLGVGSIVATRLISVIRQPKYPIIAGAAVMTIGVGLVSAGVKNNDKGLIIGSLVTAGVGVGLSLAPTAVHARFSQPEERVAVVTALNLFTRTLGGTVGLAQCAAVLNGKVSSRFASLIASGAVSGADAAALDLSSSSLGSLTSISSLSPELQQVVRGAFQNGTRWAFISLIPWAAVTFFLSLMLSNIATMDEGRKRRPSAVELIGAEEDKDNIHQVGVLPVQQQMSGPYRVSPPNRAHYAA